MSAPRIHLIANSHIDPVWLWDQYEGIDEVTRDMKPDTTECNVVELCPDLCQRLKTRDLEGLSFRFGCEEIVVL